MFFCLIVGFRFALRFCKTFHGNPKNYKGLIPQLLSMRYSSEHDAAKKSFNDVTQLLAKMLKFNEEDYVIDYFERVEADILVEKEANLQKLVAHYQQLVDDVHARKVKCLHNLKTNKAIESKLDAVKQTLTEHESKLKKDNLDVELKTLDGDEAKWRAIQSECDALSEKANSLGNELNWQIIGDQAVQFVSNTRQTTQIENMCGHLIIRTIDSTILNTYKMQNSLVELCKLSGKQFKLLYRATRDEFEASSFHAKCDHQPNTLTIINTTKGYVFGGYADVAWDSSGTFKTDANAFIFSLENAHCSPQLIQLKAGNKLTLCCNPAYGSVFGGGNDIFISNISNWSSQSYSNLGSSFDFPLYACGTVEAQSFLAGSYHFRTSEIEVFQLN